jgi:hypothetical protein
MATSHIEDIAEEMFSPQRDPRSQIGLARYFGYPDGLERGKK